MFVRQLTYLTALARERHFARAATTCNVSQPTLSAGIRSLENELDIPIVRRGRRFMGFTPEGERVLQWAQRILADLDGLKHDLSELTGGLAGQLRLGVIPSAQPIIPQLTQPLLTRHPSIGLEVLTLSSIAIQQALDRFEIELGITYLDNEPLRNVRSLPLYRERLLFATTDRARFGDRTEVGWAEIGGTSLCLLSQRMQNRRIIDAALKEAGASPTPRVETDTTLLLAAYVRSGDWSTILPTSWAWVLAEVPGVLLLPLTQPVRSHEVGIVVLDREPVPPLAQALLALARKTPIDAALAPAVG